MGDGGLFPLPFGKKFDEKAKNRTRFVFLPQIVHTVHTICHSPSFLQIISKGISRMTLSIQKASFWKRISAWLFDFILTAILAVGVATLLSAALGYEKYSAQLDACYTQYQEQLLPQYEEEYKIKLNITQAEYDGYTPEQQQAYNEAATALTNAINEALQKDANATKLYQKTFSRMLIMISGGILIGVLVIQFVVPLFFKNGQTLGKKVFGVAVMRTNCVQITNFVLFVRSIFGMYTIETMFPVALFIMVYFGYLGSIGTLTIGLLLLLELGVLIGTKNNAAIHDILSDTVTVDFASQRIFKDEKELLAYQQEQHTKEVTKQEG